MNIFILSKNLFMPIKTKDYLGIVAHAFKPGTWVAEAEDLSVFETNLTGLHSKFLSSLQRSCLKITTNQIRKSSDRVTGLQSNCS